MEELLKLLSDKNLTISFAESMTGGALSTSLTKHNGASKAFKGAVIAYSNEVKVNVLNVLKETIINKSVVSKEVAIEMVEGLKKIINSDISLSITGNAGPTLEENTSEFKCYISVLYQNKLYNYEEKFKTNNRNKNINNIIKNVKNIVYNLVL
ncbi:MAG TPA: CinA family protein [Acholeplasma sp.]|nr:CinA family protein [Acholeplasma sp.]